MKRATLNDVCSKNKHLFRCIPLGHEHDGDNKFWSLIYIKHDNKVYILFNVVITSLCLISSYYYASLVGFRYSAGGEIDVDHETPTLIFEIFFLIHMIL